MISPNSTLKTCTLDELHSSPIARHLGFQKVDARACHCFFCTGMKNNILTFLDECYVCQHNKGEIIKLLGTLQPLPLHAYVYTDVSIDFIAGLLMSSNTLVIMVVVDKISKYAHFFTLTHPFIPTLVA